MKTLVEDLQNLLTEQGMYLATAESCTGGRIAAALTARVGCSAWYKGGIVAYSNEAKTNLLGVRPETLAQHGAVSEETVREMAIGALYALHADCAVATTGIAGPDGGTPTKPVGTIWVCVAGGAVSAQTICLTGDKGREANAVYAAEEAIRLLINQLQLRDAKS
jgi:PncC family amidohydrolase